MVANPTAFNPMTDPESGQARRDLALQDMCQQGYLTPALYKVSKVQPLPTAKDLQQPQEPGRGSVLHQLASAPDPARRRPGPGVPHRTLPSTAPTTAV